MMLNSHKVGQVVRVNIVSTTLLDYKVEDSDREMVERAFKDKQLQKTNIRNYLIKINVIT